MIEVRQCESGEKEVRAVDVETEEKRKLFADQGFPVSIMANTMDLFGTESHHSMKMGNHELEVLLFTPRISVPL